MPVKIITDSTAYIDRRLLKELDITEVSMTVNFEEHSCLETELANEEFISELLKWQKLPTSSPAFSLNFYQAFWKG